MNDDRVLSLALACELYRQTGARPGRVLAIERRRKTQREYEPPGVKAGVT
jgi:hypothetical protein